MNAYTQRLLQALYKKAVQDKDSDLFDVVIGMAKANGGVK